MSQEVIIECVPRLPREYNQPQQQQPPRQNVEETGSAWSWQQPQRQSTHGLIPVRPSSPHQQQQQQQFSAQVPIAVHGPAHHQPAALLQPPPGAHSPGAQSPMTPPFPQGDVGHAMAARGQPTWAVGTRQPSPPRRQSTPGPHIQQLMAQSVSAPVLPRAVGGAPMMEDLARARRDSREASEMGTVSIPSGGTTPSRPEGPCLPVKGKGKQPVMVPLLQLPNAPAA